MRRSPEISVLVATYNQGRFLKGCLESLLSQSLHPSVYEVLVVDDGSTASTAQLLSGYRDRVHSIHLKAHRGLAAACNVGLERARGRFLVRVDSDDRLDPRALFQLLQATRGDGENVILLPDHWEVRGKVRRRVSPDVKDVFSWLAAGVLMPLEQVRRAGGYRPLFWEEVDLYLRLLERGVRPARLPKPLPRPPIRRSGSNTSPSRIQAVSV